MSKIFKSNVLLDKRADLTASGANNTPSIVAIATTTEALAVNHVFEMCVLPPGYGVADIMVGVEDLDTGGSPAIILACGLMIGEVGDSTFANRTASSLIGTEFFSGSNVGQAGGIARLNKVQGLLLTPSADRRSIGVQVTTAPATSAAAGVRIVLVAQLRPLYAGM